MQVIFSGVCIHGAKFSSQQDVSINQLPGLLMHPILCRRYYCHRYLVLLSKSQKAVKLFQ